MYRFQAPWLESVPIAVSNNIDEKELLRLAQKVEWKRDRWWIPLGWELFCQLQ